MIGCTQLIHGLLNALQATEHQITPPQRTQFELDVLQPLLPLIDNLYRKSRDYLNGSDQSASVEQEWRALHEAATQGERSLRRQELSAPSSEDTFVKTLWWVCERGAEEELALLRRVRQQPPFTTAAVLELLAHAEMRLSSRCGLPAEEPVLPEAIRREACFQTVVTLGDALNPDGTGTVTEANGVRTWHVKVRRKADGVPQGVLHIREGDLEVEWVPSA